MNSLTGSIQSTGLLDYINESNSLKKLSQPLILSYFVHQYFIFLLRSMIVYYSWFALVVSTSALLVDRLYRPSRSPSSGAGILSISIYRFDRILNENFLSILFGKKARLMLLLRQKKKLFILKRSD